MPVMIHLERAFRLGSDMVGLVGTRLLTLTSILARCSQATFSSSFARQIDLAAEFAVLVVGEQLELHKRLVGELNVSLAGAR